jgi:hypothetical protein
MTGLLTTLLLLPPAAPGFTGHHRPRPDVACCDVCGVESAEVAELIATLQRCPRWRKRDNAAHALKRYDWRCHPEAAQVLAAAMLCDGEEEVREEAAESLAKMKPCLPEVHAALARAAKCDPDHATRKWARRGLVAVGERCVAQCDACGIDPALPVRYVVPGSVREEVILPPVAVPYEPPIAPPADEVTPPSELPPLPEASSPFLSPAASRPRDNRAAVEKPAPPAPRFTLGRILRPGRSR